MLVAALAAAMLIGIAAFGGHQLAGDYIRTDGELTEHARGLVPEGGRIVLEDGSQCSRSGWEGLFTLRDTCADIYWELPGTTPEERLPILSGRATAQGWNIEATHIADRSGQLVVARPGYIAHIVVFSEETLEACRTAPLPREPTERTCWDHITIESRD